MPVFSCGGLSPATVWSPNSLGSALQVWYKADAGITLSGSNVTLWADQSGNSHDLTVFSGTPTYSGTGFNGKQGVIFTNAGNDGLATSAFNIASNAASFFMVCNVTQISFGDRMLAYFIIGGENDYFGTDNILAFVAYPGNISTQNDTEFTQLNMGWTNGSNGRLGVVLDNSNATQYLGNAQTAQQPASYTLGAAGSRLTVGGNGVAPPNMTVAEIVMTKSALLSTDRLKLDNYFREKWGL